MITVDDIFQKFGGPSSFAGAVGVKVSAASEMRRRKSIPVRYWPKIVNAAEQREIVGVNYDSLVQMHQPTNRVSA